MVDCELGKVPEFDITAKTNWKKVKTCKVCVVVSHSLFSKALFSLWERKFGSGASYLSHVNSGDLMQIYHFMPEISILLCNFTSL